MGLKQLFKDHIERVTSGLSRIITELHLDGLIISSGQHQVYFEDDQDIPFRRNHHFRYLCPLEGPGHLIVLRPGKKIVLQVFQPEDFWHEVRPFEVDFWTDEFEIQICSQESALWKDLIGSHEKMAFHGPEVDQARNAGCLVQVEGLLPRMNWLRLNKTPYEQHCLWEATRLAAEGHKAAERAFRQGGSELDIHFAYLQATRCRDQDLPYENIVCLNEKASFLHYSAKRDDVHNGRVMLIDAGGQIRGYASDITRTYATEESPEEFRALLASMEDLQQSICASIRPGSRMNDLHLETHQRIAQILTDHRILLQCSAEEAFTKGFTSAFFPHGLGHMLGLLVHDVAGRQIDPVGTLGEVDPRFPRLRTVRPLEAGTCVTIEPGLYFIRMLLEPYKKSDTTAFFNWSLIDRLYPCGGIRIEDDILIQDNAVRNLTREFLP
jgi:Xaa-Pro dipeptidase